MWQIILLLGFPYLTIQISRRSGKAGEFLSPVVLAYAGGMALRNLTPLSVDQVIATQASQITILLAIPLLLFSTQFGKLTQWAGPALRSFGFCVLAGLAVSGLATGILGPLQSNAWQVSGMLVGLYTGGTPNMQAIGLALRVPQETIVLLNAADILLGGLYLIFLSSVAHPLLGKVLPSFPREPATTNSPTTPTTAAAPVWSWSGAVWALTISILILALVLGLCWIGWGNLDQPAFILLGVTTGGILAGLNPAISRLEQAFPLGEYLLLIFCVALGLLADLADMIAHGGSLLIFSAVVMFGTIAVHLVLARIFRIDRDTFMITSTAAIYGPPFVAQIASAIGNRQLLLPGIATGLLGYAIGNYLGISWAYLLAWAFQ